MKKILFISALDFKDKSIQVIKKTPEYYAENGWVVDYLVMRDNTLLDNYFYENEINPKNLNIYRIYLPFTKVINLFAKFKYINRLIHKFSYFAGVFKLSYYFFKHNLNKKNYDIIYGYEVHGILVVQFLKLILQFKNSKIIHRFQGSFMFQYLTFLNYSKILSNYDHLIALLLKADLYIMTNDGTFGDKLFNIIKKNDLDKLLFWRNGVDIINVENNFINKRFPTTKYTFLTISRLNKWKRVDKSIDLLSNFKFKSLSKLIIIGDGPELNNLKLKVKQLNLNDIVFFEGAVSSLDVKYYLDYSNIFLSFYDGSNVGNPLFEAIRSNKLIITINNGDTGNYIKHKENGLIYDFKHFNYTDISNDIIEIFNNDLYRQKIHNNLKNLEKNKLWTWEERFNSELIEINKLLE